MSVNAWFDSDTFLRSSRTILLLAPVAHRHLPPRKRVNRLLRHLCAHLLPLHTVHPLPVPILRAVARPSLLTNLHNVSIEGASAWFVYNPLPLASHCGHIVGPVAVPSRPASRRSPSGHVPFESLSRTPPSPSPPQSRSLSPAIPAPHRQPESHQSQSKPSPPGMSAMSSIPSRFLPAPSQARPLLPLARRPCSNSLRALSFGRMDATCCFCGASIGLRDGLLAGRALQRSPIVAIVARRSSTLYRPPPLRLRPLSLIKPPKHTTFDVIFNNTIVPLHSRVAPHLQQPPSKFENCLDHVDHMDRRMWLTH